jgi:hypothetical protein
MRTGQQHACELINGNAAVAQLVARIKKTTERSLLYDRRKERVGQIKSRSIEKIENRIVKSFVSLSPDRQQELLSKLCKMHPDTKLVFMDRSKSIGLYYLCRPTSWARLRHLFELYRSGRLQMMIDQLFTVLIEGGRPVEVDSLTWNMSDYNRISEYMYECAGLSVFSEIYSLASVRVDGSFITYRSTFNQRRRLTVSS